MKTNADFTKEPWQIAYDLLQAAVPSLQTEEEKVWVDEKLDLGRLEVDELRARWYTNVPGYRAPDMVLVGAVQAMANRGYDVSDAKAMLPDIQKAYNESDDIKLLKLGASLFHSLGHAPKNPEHSYWDFEYFENFAQVEQRVEFPDPVDIVWEDETWTERIRAAWLAQIAGAGIGTMLEGYTTDQILKAFGDVRSYLRQPTTHNDDILFELALLEAVVLKGRDVTSTDIALEWVGRISYFWTAEEAAYKNLKRGIFPPHSGMVNNPWNEWIGAQMRGSVCGLVFPGDPRRAAELAWKDGVISHINNGVLGEMFNAILTSLAFVYDDVRELLAATISLMPKTSEYYKVVDFAYQSCLNARSWRKRGDRVKRNLNVTIGFTRIPMLPRRW